MGFQSWITSEGESIPNVASSRPTFTVYMVAPDGRRWAESGYTGYGRFDGEDFYELVAELNGGDNRVDGLGIYLRWEAEPDGEFQPVLPRFTRDPGKAWATLSNPRMCEYQGYFYPSEGGDGEDVFGLRDRVGMDDDDVIWGEVRPDEAFDVPRVESGTLEKLGVHIEVQSGTRIGETEVRWRHTGRQMLWLTSASGQEVCIPGASVSLTPDGVTLTITATRRKAADGTYEFVNDVKNA